MDLGNSRPREPGHQGQRSSQATPSHRQAPPSHGQNAVRAEWSIERKGAAGLRRPHRKVEIEIS